MIIINLIMTLIVSQKYLKRKAALRSRLVPILPSLTLNRWGQTGEITAYSQAEIALSAITSFPAQLPDPECVDGDGGVTKNSEVSRFALQALANSREQRAEQKYRSARRGTQGERMTTEHPGFEHRTCMVHDEI